MGRGGGGWLMRWISAEKGGGGGGGGKSEVNMSPVWIRVGQQKHLAEHA